jgi:hypothetical protein
MDLDKLYEILKETTVSLRKGETKTEKTEGNVKVVNLYFMPHVSDVTDVEKVDLHFIVVGVKKAEAEKRKGEFIELIKTYPDFNRFRQGLSYIELGGEIGSQEEALKLMALGNVLGLWDIITPEKLGITGEKADELAGGGMVMIAGYNPR